MHEQVNKQNTNLFNSPESTSFDSEEERRESLVKPRKSQNYQTQPEICSEILQTIQKERTNNLALYQRIKEQYQFFQYSLRSQPHPHLHYTSLIQEYDKIMAERQHLEKQFTKTEFQVNRIQRQKTSPFAFMTDLWKNKREGTCASEEIVERLNKTVILMKQGISTCIQRQSQQNQGYSDQMVRKSYVFKCLQKQYDELQQKYNIVLQEKENYKKSDQKDYTKFINQNQKFSQVIAALQLKNRQLQISELDFYKKINKLTTQIMFKEQHIEQLNKKVKQTLKYVHKENNTIQYQLNLRIENMTLVQEKTVRNCQKTLAELIEFLSQQGRKQYQERVPLGACQLDHNMQLPAAQDTNSQQQPSVLSQQSYQQQYNNSSSKKTKRTRPVTFLSSHKKQALEPSLTELRFIRRK